MSANCDLILKGGPDGVAFRRFWGVMPSSSARPQPWRQWYNTAEWRDLKQQAHERDNYTCRMCGTICGGKSPDPDTPIADHIRPHRGSRALFFDLDNLQTLCKSPCHDKVKQSEEQASRMEVGVWD